MVDQDTVVDEIADDDTATRQVSQPGQAAEPANAVADGNAELVGRTLGDPLVLATSRGVSAAPIVSGRAEMRTSWETYEELSSASDR